MHMKISAKTVSDREESIERSFLEVKEAAHDKMANDKKGCSEGNSEQVKTCIPEKMASNNEGKTKTGF